MHYSTDSNTITTGFRVLPTERFNFGFDLVWNDATGALDQLNLSAPEWAATHPAQTFDFTQTHTYSDLDTSRLEAGIELSYALYRQYWVNAGYRYADYQDDAPYLYDTTGKANYYSLSVSRSF